MTTNVLSRWRSAGSMAAGALGLYLALAVVGPSLGHGLPTVDSTLSLGAIGVAYNVASALDHPTRRRIYDHLLILPGNHFRSIVRTLEMSYGTTRHHLDVLVREGLVRRVRSNGFVRFYPRGKDAELQKNQLYERHWDFRDLRLRVLFAVRRAGVAGPSDVGRALGISRQLAAYHLARLQETGYLRKEHRRYRA